MNILKNNWYKNFSTDYKIFKNRYKEKWQYGCNTDSSQPIYRKETCHR